MTTAQAIEAPDEAGRIAAVRRYEILDTPPDGAFDRITAIAARLFNVPVSIVSVVDTDRIWFKSRHGLVDVVELDREPGLCASAILGTGPWVLTDAAADPRALANPLVAGEFGLRFYAGVPLRTHDGYNLGTLCVLDTAPRLVTDEEIALLEDLAALVMDQLELRLQAREVLRAEAALRRDAERLADALQASLLPPTPPTVPGMDVAALFVAGEQGLSVGGDFLDVFRLGPNDWAVVLGDVCGKGARAAALTGLTRWTVRAAAVHSFAPTDVLRDLNTTLLDHGDADDHFCTAVLGRLELDVCGAWVTLAVSGHPQPILVRASGLVERRRVSRRGSCRCRATRTARPRPRAPTPTSDGCPVAAGASGVAVRQVPVASGCRRATLGGGGAGPLRVQRTGASSGRLQRTTSPEEWPRACRTAHGSRWVATQRSSPSRTCGRCRGTDGSGARQSSSTGRPSPSARASAMRRWPSLLPCRRSSSHSAGWLATGSRSRSTTTVPNRSARSRVIAFSAANRGRRATAIGATAPMSGIVNVTTRAPVLDRARWIACRSSRSCAGSKCGRSTSFTPATATAMSGCMATAAGSCWVRTSPASRPRTARLA